MLEDSTFLEQLFSLGNLIATVGWVILILLPRQIKFLSMVPKLLVPLLLSFAYAVLIVVSLFNGNEGGFGSLADVQKLMKNEVVLLAGWFHYLAFDLFIGAIIAQRADAIGISRLIQAPILFLTFMAGPLGLFLFYCTYGGWNIFSSRQPKTS